MENATVTNRELSNINKTLKEFNEINDSINTLELLSEELSEEDYNKELNNIENLLNEKVNKRGQKIEPDIGRYKPISPSGNREQRG